MIGLQHSRPLPCSCSRRHDEVQSGLFDMLLIFHANICVRSGSSRNQPPVAAAAPDSLTPPPVSTPLLLSLQHRVRRSATLSSRPTPEFSTTQVIPLSLLFVVLLRRSQSLPSVGHRHPPPPPPSPPPSPSPPPRLTRSVCHTALDTLTGGGSQAGQFLPGLGLLCIRIAKGFSVFRLDCTPA